MTDTYSRILLTVIAVSLAVIAWTGLADRMDQTAPEATAPMVADAGPDCGSALKEERTMLQALEAQMKHVPATVRDTRDDKRSADDAEETPNRLYEQLMLQIIETKARIKDMETQCRQR